MCNHKTVSVVCGSLRCSDVRIKNRYFKDMIKITNIKFSVKIFGEWSLQRIQEHCARSFHKHSRLVGSKLIIRIPNQSKRIIVFPKKRGRLQHINFTGINQFEEIQKILELATSYLNCEITDFINLTIDNIWAKTDGLMKNMMEDNIKSLNLKSFLTVLKRALDGADVRITFRPESFSAIVLRGFNCTTLIYSTGSVIIVGARDYSCILKITELLSTISLCQASNFVLTLQ